MGNSLFRREEIKRIDGKCGSHPPAPPPAYSACNTLVYVYFKVSLFSEGQDYFVVLVMLLSAWEDLWQRDGERGSFWWSCKAVRCSLCCAGPLCGVRLSGSKEPTINSALGTLEIFRLHSACNSQQLSFERKLHGGSAQHPFSAAPFKACSCLLSRRALGSGMLALRASLGKDGALLQLFFHLASLWAPSGWLAVAGCNLLATSLFWKGEGAGDLFL